MAHAQFIPNLSERNQTSLRKYLTVVAFVYEHLKCLRGLIVRYVIRFLSTKGAKAAEIHWRSVKFMSKILWAMEWYRNELEILKMTTRLFITWDEVGKSHSLLKVWCRKLTKQLKDNRCFAISSLSSTFNQVLWSVLYEIVTRCLNYRFALWQCCPHRAN